MNPKLSVCIAVHNREKYIANALSSALGVPYENKEIIVFDDASSDSSPKIVRDLIDKHGSILRYIRSDKNIGCALARASMTESAHGDYILVLDDDDILLPFDIDAVVKFMEANPDYAVSYGKAYLVDSALKPLNMAAGSSFSCFALSHYNPVPHPGSVIRRSALLEAGNYMQTGNGIRSVAVDLSLWFRLALSGKFHYNPEFRVLYRQHNEQMTLDKESCYKEALSFIFGMILEKKSELCNGIRSGNLKISHTDLNQVMLLLGIMHRCGDIKDRKNILDAAYKIAPDDFALALVRGDYFMACRDYDSAIAEMDRLLNISNDVFISKKALEKLLDICRNTGHSSNSELEKEISVLNAAYMQFNIAQIKKYL